MNSLSQRLPWIVVLRNRRGEIFRQIRRLWRLGRLITYVVVGVLIAHGVFGVLVLTGVDQKKCLRRALVRWWNQGVLRTLNVHLHLEGQIATGAVLYTPNHISWLDIPCLRSVVDAVFVAKEDVHRWPVIGRLSKRAGTIFLKRGGHNASNETAEHMTWSLARHQSVIVFPEGTTSEGRTVRYFYGRLYQSVVRTRGEVQAVAIAYPHADGTHPHVPFTGDDDLVRHLWRLLKEDKIDARLVFCPPLPAAGQERRALAARTRVQVLETLGMMPGAAAEK